MNDIDYSALADWCHSRKGQVIVCENEGADWLPFERLCEQVGANRAKRSMEVIWHRSTRVRWLFEKEKER